MSASGMKNPRCLITRTNQEQRVHYSHDSRLHDSEKAQKGKITNDSSFHNSEMTVIEWATYVITRWYSVWTWISS